MQIKIIKSDPRAIEPTYATMGAAGFDFYCIEPFRIEPGETYVVDTGLIMEIPWGYELQIRPRSGVSFKTKIRVANSPGTIDSDYRGVIGIILENIGEMAHEFNQHDRVAQGIVSPVIQADFIMVEEDSLSKTERNDGGFGSTGS